MDERAEVSEHLVRIFRYLSKSKWSTSKEIASGSGVAHRTARAHLQKLVALGICDQAELFPAHQYRLSPQAEKRNKAMMLRLRAADGIFSDGKEI